MLVLNSLLLYQQTMFSLSGEVVKIVWSVIIIYDVLPVLYQNDSTQILCYNRSLSLKWNIRDVFVEMYEI